MVLGALQAPPEVLLLGALAGLGYGLVAVGLVLVFRASRVINFAHGQVGALGAVLLGVMVQRWGAPYWLAFVAAIVVGALISAAIEVLVVRRLRVAPPLMTLVATLGVAQVLLFLTMAVGAELTSGRLFPQPAGLPAAQVGALKLTQASFALLVLGPVAVAALWLLLRRTMLGAAMRASAANPDGARTLGIRAPRMATLAWALSGALAALTAALVLPAGAVVNAEALGPALLLRALAAGAIAGMASLPVALIAGVGIGVAEQVAVWNAAHSGLPELVLFAVIVGALLVRPAARHRLAEREDWTALRRWAPLPPAARAVPLVRWAGPVMALVALGLAAAAPLAVSGTDEVTLTGVVAFALVGLSVWVITGLGGQLSLGQFALAGVGAMIAAAIAESTGSPALGLLAAPVAGAAVAVAIGLPALRIQGVMLAVVTLGFALAAEAWLFQRPWALGDGVSPDKLDLGPVGFDTTWGAYLLSLAALAGCLVVVANLARGGFGRRLRAVRDNDHAARALGVPAALLRLQAFAVSGAIAALGGAVLVQALSRTTPASFAAATSIDMVAMAVLGGLAIMGGPLLGALYIVALPAFVDLSTVALAATAFGWLLLVVAVPGGLAALLEPLRRGAVKLLLRVSGHDPALARAAPPPDDRPPDAVGQLALARGAATRDGRPRPRAPALALDGLVCRFGAVRAVDGVSLSLAPGETVGLVGPNGAGKTTVLDLACGFVRGQAGRVRLAGVDVSALPGDARARLGLARSFQDAALFATLTVAEVVALGLERGRPTRLLVAASGWPAPERAKRRRARELVALFGLQEYADSPIHTLSTGTRRLAELACVLALAPRVLLLDEPSAGLAQREAEALAALLARLRGELGLTMLIVEHDLPLVSGLADRLAVMAEGRLVAQGPPAALAVDARVRRAYGLPDARIDVGVDGARPAVTAPRVPTGVST